MKTRWTIDRVALTRSGVPKVDVQSCTVRCVVTMTMEEGRRMSHEAWIAEATLAELGVQYEAP